MIKKFIARHIYEPLYYLFYRRDNALKYYEDYKTAQWNSPEENKTIQAVKLYKLLKYAIEEIPYYKQIAKQEQISISQETIFEDVRKFPILTKEILRSDFLNMSSIKPGVKWYFNTSGGSTGTPSRFIQDRTFEAESNAITRMQYDWCGYSVGDRFVQLWASHTDLLKSAENTRHKFAQWMKSTVILDAISMNEEKMQSYVDAINKIKPLFILAYAQSITELADFINRRNLIVYSPRAIMTSANVLYDYSRKTIEKAFGCSVFNRYGSREVGNIASECERHEGLHLSIFTHYIEILNSNLEPCREGESGDIYITLLTNYTMPLIRYKIGDVATYTENMCSCGRGLPIIKEIVGRNNDIFITADGTRVHTAIINMQFYFRDWVKQYQVLQKKPDEILIKIVVAEHHNTANLDMAFAEIENNLKRVMGAECSITFEIVDAIEATPSGKYRYTIREF